MTIPLKLQINGTDQSETQTSMWYHDLTPVAS